MWALVGRTHLGAHACRRSWLRFADQDGRAMMSMAKDCATLNVLGRSRRGGYPPLKHGASHGKLRLLSASSNINVKAVPGDGPEPPETLMTPRLLLLEM